ncbi:T9SS type A sorting domain-containing protein [Lacinutrix iliipiscaria]|uniref:T9SS type A sorting domain-containing protein n=1 Tax=Lacinutrix iliipiscaria TaxID=1230532 RepID=A0ABW5WRY6_9FLAO
MKSQKFSLLFIFVITISVHAQNTYVPDDNFEYFLETHSDWLTEVPLGDPSSYGNGVMDDFVPTVNISGEQDLWVDNQGISDMTGLEDFESLTSFNCDGNSITSLTFHPNANLNFFVCQNNLLTELDLSQHTSLFEFGCTNNPITNLDFSFNTNLRYLYISGITVSEIDTSPLSSLMEIFCGSNINLTSLDFSQNPSLYAIYASNNSNIQNVDLRNGNNTNLNNSEVIFSNSPNLDLIYVDDCTYSTDNWTSIDSHTVFIENEGQTECGGLSVDDYLLKNSVSVYPNPVVNTLFLDNSNNQNIEHISIYNFEGKLVKQHNYGIDKIDFKNFSSGMYFLRIETEQGALTKKIIKN